MKTYKALAQYITAYCNCCNTNNTEWMARWEKTIAAIMKTAPSGSGIDCGTKFDVDDQITALKGIKVAPRGTLRFGVEFHHMDENGMYDGWTHHAVTVRPDLAHDIAVYINGADRNGIKDYLSDVYYEWLCSECTVTP